MEEYEEFVQHLLPQLRRREEKEEENHRPSSASSVIRFYGRSILPPLVLDKFTAVIMVDHFSKRLNLFFL